MGQPGFPMQMPNFNIFGAPGAHSNLPVPPTFVPIQPNADNPMIHQHLQHLQQIILAKD
jgi:hypothetical protein